MYLVQGIRCTTTDVLRAEGAPSVAMGRTPHQAHDTACMRLR